MKFVNQDRARVRMNPLPGWWWLETRGNLEHADMASKVDRARSDTFFKLDVAVARAVNAARARP